MTDMTPEEIELDVFEGEPADVPRQIGGVQDFVEDDSDE